MDLRHLRYFVAVAEERHVGRAAARLYVAQPALSRQLKDIEEELGVRLLERGPRGVEVTPEGAGVLDHARRVLDEAAAAVDRALHAAEGLHGKLVVGVGRALFWQEVMLRVRARAHERLPNVEFEFLEVEAGRPQWDQVRSGRLDLAIGLQPPLLESIRAEPIFDATLDCALVPATHALAARESLRPADLGALPLLLAPPESHPTLVAAMRDEVQRLGITSTLDDSYSGLHAIWLAIAHGRGWCPMPFFMRHGAPEGTVAIPVDDLHIPMTNAAIWRAGDDRPALRLLLGVLRSVRDQARQPSAKPDGPSPARGARRREVGTVPVGLELRHLRALAVVVREPSLGRAAARLGVTQPALSRQIRGLEDEVGTPLIERTARGVQATDAGRSLGADCARILGGVDELLAGVSRARRRRRREIILGCIEMAAVNPVVVALLRRCRGQQPALDVVPTVLPPLELVRDVREGTVDLALVPLGAGHDVDPAFERFPLTSDVIDSALVATAHPLAGRPLLRRTDLAEYPFLFINPTIESEHYARVLHAMERAGLRAGTVLGYPTLETTWEMARQGKGWTVGLRRYRAQPPPGLAAIPIDGLAIAWGLDLMWRAGDDDPMVAQVIAAARDAGRENAG